MKVQTNYYFCFSYFDILFCFTTHSQPLQGCYFSNIYYSLTIGFILPKLVLYKLFWRGINQ